jgi:tetratricopeptide (TPR) repeat protein
MKIVLQSLLILGLCHFSLAQTTPVSAKAQSQSIEEYVLAHRHIQSHHYKEALPHLDKAIHLDPNNTTFYYEKAKCHAGLKEYDLAVKDLQTAVRIRKDYDEAHRLIGYIYSHNLHKPLEAVTAYQAAYIADKDNLKKFADKINIIVILEKEHLLPQAHDHIKDAEALGVEHYLLGYYKGKLANQEKHYDLAKKSLQTATHLIEHPKTLETDINHRITILKGEAQDPSKCYYELYYALYHLNEYQEAQKLVPKVITKPYSDLIKEMNTDYLSAVAYAHFTVFDYVTCEKFVHQVQKLEPKNHIANELNVKLAEVHTDKSPLIKQYEHSLNVLSNDKERVGIKKKLVHLLLQRGDNQKALDIAESLTKLDTHHEHLYHKAVALNRLNRQQEALAVMQSVVQQSGLDEKTKSEYEFFMGIIALKLNQFEVAKEAFKQATFKYFRSAAHEEMKVVARHLHK